MSKRLFGLFLCFATFPLINTGCGLNAAPGCLTGQEKCDNDALGGGIYYYCSDNNSWSQGVTCGKGCDGKHCAATKLDVACETDGAKICTDITQHHISISFVCHHQNWQPTICSQGSQCDGDVCSAMDDSCKEGSQMCTYVKAIGRSVEFNCINGSWISTYCAEGVDCDGPACKQMPITPVISCETADGTPCDEGMIPHSWASGVCEQHECHLLQCNPGYTLINGDCYPSGECCGEFCADCTNLKKVCSSSETLLGECIPSCQNETVNCNSVCIDPAISAEMCECNTGFHTYEGQCEANDNDNCGEHNHSCQTSEVTNSVNVSCDITTGICKANECDTGFHTYEGQCEANDNDNCGEHGHPCRPEDITGSETVSCNTGICVAETCDGEHIKSGNGCLEKICTDDEVICVETNNIGEVKKCMNNEWQIQQTCTTSCKGNACGDCVNTNKQCGGTDGLEYQSCTGGEWNTLETCATNITDASPTCDAITGCSAICQDINQSICSNACINTKSDPNNCGECENKCPVPTGGTATCNSSKCGYTCNEESGYCNTGTTCEYFDLKNDPDHCGDCITSCGNLSIGSYPVCNNGSCDIECNDHYEFNDDGDACYRVYYSCKGSTEFCNDPECTDDCISIASSEWINCESYGRDDNSYCGTEDWCRNDANHEIYLRDNGCFIWRLGNL